MKAQSDQALGALGGATSSSPGVLKCPLKLLKYIWAFPVTFFGLVAVVLTMITGGSVEVVSGAVEASGGFAERLIDTLFHRKVYCMTLGHVILSLDAEKLARWSAHEHVHVGQYEKWGPFFIPLYIASSLWAQARGKHCYRDNVFEREAYAKAP